MSRVATSSGHLFFAFPVRRRPTCACTLLPPPPRHLYPDVTLKPFSTCPSIQQDDLATTASEQPRWKAPPLRMVSQGASNRSFRPQPPKPFSVNEDPKRLDHVFERVLGEDGDEMLTDEVKWLTVTHKSFDHGRRGFNDRLAYLGKRVLELRASLEMLAVSMAIPEVTTLDQWGREPFKHPVLEGLAGLTRQKKDGMLDKRRMAQLARKYGLVGVLRWKPKEPDNLEASGVDVVATQAMYAIVGAVSLQRGGQVANRVCRERILAPLGLKGGSSALETFGQSI